MQRRLCSKVSLPQAAQLIVIAQNIRQAIERYPAAQMMQVVHADIRGEPRQDDGQIVVRAAVQRGVAAAPIRRDTRRLSECRYT